LDTVDELGTSGGTGDQLFDAFAGAFASFADALNRASPPSDARGGNAAYVSRLRSLAFRLEKRDLTVLEELDNDDGIRVPPETAARLNAVEDLADPCIELTNRGGTYMFETDR
jgi:hypothetical protein